MLRRLPVAATMIAVVIAAAVATPPTVIVTWLGDRRYWGAGCGLKVLDFSVFRFGLGVLDFHRGRLSNRGRGGHNMLKLGMS